MRLDDSFLYDLESIGEPGSKEFHRAFPNTEYGYSDFKRDVTAWMFQKFGADAEPGTKAIRIKGVTIVGIVSAARRVSAVLEGSSTLEQALRLSKGLYSDRIVASTAHLALLGNQIALDFSMAGRRQGLRDGEAPEAWRERQRRRESVLNGLPISAKL